MTRTEIITAFSNINITLHPAGKWELVDGKKQAVDAARKDDLPLDAWPLDNMFKFKVQSSGYIILDSDTLDHQQLEQLHSAFPFLAATFYTTTTALTKRHYYLAPPEGITPPRFRHTGIALSDTDPFFDLFTHGTLFEGHCFDHNPYYKIVANPVHTLSREEYDSLLSLVPHSIKAQSRYKNDIIIRTYREEHYKAAQALLALPDDETTLEKFTHLKMKEANLIIRNLFTKEALAPQLSSPVKKLTLPPFSYSLINGTAYKLTTNQAIDSAVREAVLRRILRLYSLDPDSPLSRKKLYNTILATLPDIDSDTRIREEGEFPDILSLLQLNETSALVKYVDQKGQIEYLKIDTNTYIPQLVGASDNASFSPATARLIYQEYTGQQIKLNDFQVMGEFIKIINDPYKPRLSFNHDPSINMFELNLSPRTIYQEQAVPDPHFPDNIVTRALSSYFGPEYLPVYLNWLAQLMFGKVNPQMIVMLVTHDSVKGGTGKTLAAAAIPSRLVGATKIYNPQDLTDKWADAFIDNALVGVNDMPKMSPKEWDNFFAKIRNQSTGGLNRGGQAKFGSFLSYSDRCTFSISANFLPPLKELDRRCWVVKPQHLYGETEPISQGEAMELNMMIEATPLTEYHPEFMELANHLKFLAEEELTLDLKYALFKEAPETPYFRECVALGQNHSSSLLIRLKEGPQSLTSIIPDSQRPQLINLIQFALTSIDRDDKNPAVPWNWLAELASLVHNGVDDQSDMKLASLATKLGVEESFLNKKLGEGRTWWKKDPRYQHYTTYGLYLEQIDFDGDVWKAWVEEEVNDLAGQSEIDGINL